MLFDEINYLRQLGYRLDLFKEASVTPKYLARCRCQLCGDSQKNSRKTRGYFYSNKDHLNYTCHNCGASMSFVKFMQWFDPGLYSRFVMETYIQKTPKRVVEELPDFRVKLPEPTILSSLDNIHELEIGHYARNYVVGRMIPEKFWSDLYYAPKFSKWASKHSDKFTGFAKKDHSRLIIPWRDSAGRLTAYSARSLHGEEPKYYTVSIKEEKGFCGLDRIDFDKRIYVVEGAIDSLCIPNCVAVGSSALWKFSMVENVTYIPDTDIRNKEIMKIVWGMITDGLSVCMLPKMDGIKDINEMVQAGCSQEKIVDLIDSHTYQGLEAQLRFGIWSKVGMNNIIEKRLRYDNYSKSY